MSKAILSLPVRDLFIRFPHLLHFRPIYLLPGHPLIPGPMENVLHLCVRERKGGKEVREREREREMEREGGREKGREGGRRRGRGREREISTSPLLSSTTPFSSL